jgi:N-acetylmuramoyl-L-alanine amidase
LANFGHDTQQPRRAEGAEVDATSARGSTNVEPGGARAWLLRITGGSVLAGLLLVVGAVAAAAYEVRPGDTLSAIAARQGTSVDALARANDLTDPNRIFVGQVLTIPRTSAPAAASRADVGRLLETVAGERGWSPAFVKALAWQESGWNNDRVSSAGAIGIMQVMPGTGAFVARELEGRPLDLTDPYDNVVAGVAFLDHLYELTDGDVEQLLAGYYQGLRSVRLNGRYPSTDRYIANVLALRERFR